jgi:hypothetical protein
MFETPYGAGAMAIVVAFPAGSSVELRSTDKPG